MKTINFVKYSELSPIDKYHEDVREWIEENGFPAVSLDELDPLTMDHKQYAEWNVWMAKYDELTDSDIWH